MIELVQITGGVRGLGQATGPSLPYTVRSDDSLSFITWRYGLPCAAWLDLYALNRAVIGSNPSVLSVGTVLLLPPNWPSSPQRTGVMPSGYRATCPPAPAGPGAREEPEPPPEPSPPDLPTERGGAGVVVAVVAGIGGLVALAIFLARRVRAARPAVAGITPSVWGGLV